jgi:hypothetical protein
MSNIGIGHGAIDAGAGYTYLNPQTGHEFSGVLGFTYNFANQSTQYQNGVDMHFDWGASQFLSKQVLIGAVGYVYTELGCDSGSGDRPTGAGDISNVGCPMKRITSSSNCQGTRCPQCRCSATPGRCRIRWIKSRKQARYHSPIKHRIT